MSLSPESHAAPEQATFYSLPTRILVGRSLAVALPLFAALYLLSRNYYLLYHSLVEFIVIVVAFTIFSIGWNARYFVSSNSLLILAVGHLALIPLQFLHVVTYSGMSILPVSDANPATQFWIAARYFEATIFIVASLMMTTRRKPFNGYLVFCIAFMASSAVILAIWPLKVFPDCFVPGSGLTTFKIASEYIICLILVCSMLMFWQHREHLDRRFLHLLLGSLGMAIAAELAFTLYQDIYGFSNFLGHLFKLCSVVFLYRALISGALRAPYSILFKDLSRAKEDLTRELVQRRQTELELREANQELDAFVRTVSHDLRTPLTPIVGLAAYLQENIDHEQQPETLESLKTIENQGRRMVRILEDLLAFARAGHSNHETQETATLDETLDRVLEDLGSLIIARGVIVKRSPLPRCTYPRTQIFQVFSNLLSNALKYACEESEPIEIQGRQADARHIEIDVVDHGPGIPARERKNIFDIYYRQRCHEDISGSGIGLATVKKIVDRLNGTIQISATEGGGATFTLTLPVSPATTPVPQPRE